MKKRVKSSNKSKMNAMVVQSKTKNKKSTKLHQDQVEKFQALQEDYWATPNLPPKC
jgi:hypothetical protein